MTPAIATPEPEASLPARVCARCGAFLPEEHTGAECTACREKQEAERRAVALYPTAYIVVLGILGNFAVAGVLAALNWRALRERTRMWMAWGIAGLGVVGVVAAIVTDAQWKYLRGLNVVGTLVAIQGLRLAYKAHRQAGGRRANLLVPLAILIAVVLITGVLGAVLLGLLEDGSGLPGQD